MMLEPLLGQSKAQSKSERLRWLDRHTVRAPIEAPSPIQAPGASIRIEAPPKSKIEIIEASHH